MEGTINSVPVGPSVVGNNEDAGNDERAAQCRHQPFGMTDLAGLNAEVF